MHLLQTGHFGDAADTLFNIDQIQLASDTVARNAIQSILDNNGVLSTIEEIANDDAIGVRDTLFITDQDDTAFIDNSAWSGTLLFSMLGSDQSFRLLGNDSTAQFNSLDDLRNILFAIDAFHYAMNFLYLKKLPYWMPSHH